jgi:cellulose biosynthesis protein BcsQ
MINLNHKEKKSDTTIIGFSSTKGGSGKSTCAYSIASAFSLKGYKVLVIDMDVPQYTTYKFFNNRSKFIKNDLISLHNVLFDISFIENHGEYEIYKNHLLKIFEEENISYYDFVILDSGGYYGPLTKLAIEFSNVLITPLNLSAIDFNVLFHYDASTDDITEGRYTGFVRESKNPYRKLQWYVIPNRCHQIMSEYQKKCLDILTAIGDLIGYKVTSIIMDRSIYSQGFDMGATCFDSIEKYFPQNQLMALNGRREINSIVDQILVGNFNSI